LKSEAKRLLVSSGDVNFVENNEKIVEARNSVNKLVKLVAVEDVAV
jgi:hypothetical protein